MKNIGLISVLFVLALHAAPAAASAKTWHCTTIAVQNSNYQSNRTAEATGSDQWNACNAAANSAIAALNTGLYAYGLACGSITDNQTMGNRHYQNCYTAIRDLEFK